MQPKHLAVAALALALVVTATGWRATSPVQTIDVGSAPSDLVFAEGHVWVAEDRALVRLNPATGRIDERIATPEGGDARQLAVAGDDAWITDGGGPHAGLVDVDLAAQRVRRVIALPCCAIGVVRASGDLWVSRPTSGAGRVLRIDPGSGRIVARVPVAPGPSQIVAARGSVWIATTQPPTSLERVDTATDRVTSYTPTGGVGDVAVGPAGLWASEDGASAVRLDPLTGRVVRRVAFPDSAEFLAVGRGAIWATASLCAACARGRVARASLVTGIAGPSVPTGETPVAIALGGGAAWIANFGDGTITRVPFGA